MALAFTGLPEQPPYLTWLLDEGRLYDAEHRFMHMLPRSRQIDCRNAHLPPA